MARIKGILGAGALSMTLAGCLSVAPEGVSDRDVANYTAAVASIGCEMKHESDYAPVEFQAGLTREQTLAITSYLVSTDRAVNLEGGGVRVTTGACA